MLKFLVFDEGGLANGLSLDHVYLFGSDNNAIRATIQFKDGMIVCQKRESGAAAMALLHDGGDAGQLVLQTCLLCEREEPYLLRLELARRRLILFYNKLEDWSMFEVSLQPSVAERFDMARRLFIEALCDQHENPKNADRLATRCLATAIEAGETLTLNRADRVLAKRCAAGMVPKHAVGCCANIQEPVEQVRADLLSALNLVLLPTPWQTIVPESGNYRWAEMDRAVNWFAQRRMGIVAGPIADFESANVPSWLNLQQLDYQTVRDLVYEHTERMVSRYRNVIRVWNVVSGLHVNGQINFSFEQLIELSRMTTMLVKKIQPVSRALVEISQPFGEYYAANHRSIPPLMYADLLMQSAVAFDGFVVKLEMGWSGLGQQSRDLMQISHLLDQFAGYGKPLTVVLAAPSGLQASVDSAAPVSQTSSYWRGPWSQAIQAKWLDATVKIAMSKPFVEAVLWGQWIDRPDDVLSQAGLVDLHQKPKQSLHQLVAFRKRLEQDPRSFSESSSSAGEKPVDRPSM